MLYRKIDFYYIQSHIYQAGSINSADLFIESMTLRLNNLNNILIFLSCLCYTIYHVLKLQENQVSATYICFKLYAVFILSLQK